MSGRLARLPGRAADKPRTIAPAARPAIVAVLAVAAAWGIALAAARWLPGAGGLVGGVTRASGGAGERLGALADALPLGYAFGVGMVAAVNPCGFALLPAYLTLSVGTTTAPAPPGRQLARAGGVGALATLGCVALFGLAGAALTLATIAIGGALPWAGVAIGTILVALGGMQLGGGALPAGPGGALAAHLGDAARRRGALGPLAYGAAYGLASLGCALPLFLGVVGTALTGGGPLAALRQFALYALGMGAVLTTLALLAALARQGAIRALRRLGPLIAPLGALLLLIAGGYVIHYWLVAGRLLGR